MSAKDIYHYAVKNALIKEGWKITNDPLVLRYGADKTEIDLGAERLLAAERDSEKIAVEVKSFIGRSKINDLEVAVGQYVLYRNLLERLKSERELYLAVAERAFFIAFQESAMGAMLLEDEQINMLIFDPKEEVILKWIKQRATGT
jgi:hypothetical protein